MISSETPYKLAEIIRDTWPGLYRSPDRSPETEKVLNIKNKLIENGRNLSL
jgi:hypothetical protein